MLVLSISFPTIRCHKVATAWRELPCGRELPLRGVNFHSYRSGVNCQNQRFRRYGKFRRISKLCFERISAIGGATFGKAERISKPSVLSYGYID